MRLNIEAGAFAEARFRNFRDELAVEDVEAVGLLTLFWQGSQQMEFTQGTKDEVVRFIAARRPKRDLIFDAMVLSNYVTDLGGGQYEIRGNKRHVEKLQHYKKLGKRGGEARAESLAHAKDSQAHANKSVSIGVPITITNTNTDTKTKKEENTSSVAAEKPLPTVTALPASVTGEWVLALLPKKRWGEIARIYENDLDWIETEARKMAVWLDANRQKAPKSSRGWNQFVTGWLSRGWEKYRRSKPKEPLRIDHDALWSKS
jgi:hypothetical protein